MTDITLPRFRPGPRITSFRLKQARWLVLGFLIVLGLSAVRIAYADYAEKKCDSSIGKLAVQLKLDSYYSNCKCMKHSLDFSDPCNSAYISVI
jgi:hypothetical protein